MKCPGTCHTPWVAGSQIALRGTAGASGAQPTSFLVARVVSSVMTILFHRVSFKSNVTFLTLHGQPQMFPEKAEDPHLYLYVETL